jgi:hypothetical protein
MYPSPPCCRADWRSVVDDVLGVHAALAVERRYGRIKPYIIGETIILEGGVE